MEILQKMVQVNKHSPLPLYYQLQEIITGLIREGQLKPGDRLPSERELCGYHQISRMTVNKALEQLVQDNYLYREKGRGTFVAARQNRKAISPLASFTAEMESQGVSAETRILNWQVSKVGEAEKAGEAEEEGLEAELDLAPGEEIYRVERLRSTAGSPFLLETTHLPRKLCPGLSREMLRDQSLYRIFREEYHYRLEQARATVEPVLLSGREAELLQAEEGLMGLLYYQITYLEDGRPIEFTRAYYRSEDYKFKLNFQFSQGKGR